MTRIIPLLSLIFLFSSVASYAMKHAENDVNRNLRMAIRSGYVGGVQKALNNGADPNTEYKGRPPLLRACQKGNIDMVKLLIMAGADVNWRPLFGYSPKCPNKSPLGVAVLHQNEEMVNLLIAAGADYTELL